MAHGWVVWSVWCVESSRISGPATGFSTRWSVHVCNIGFPQTGISNQLSRSDEMSNFTQIVCLTSYALSPLFLFCSLHVRKGTHRKPSTWMPAADNSSNISCGNQGVETVEEVPGLVSSTKRIDCSFSQRLHRINETGQVIKVNSQERGGGGGIDVPFFYISQRMRIVVHTGLTCTLYWLFLLYQRVPVHSRSTSEGDCLCRLFWMSCVGTVRADCFGCHAWKKTPDDDCPPQAHCQGNLWTLFIYFYFFLIDIIGFFIV